MFFIGTQCTSENSPKSESEDKVALSMLVDVITQRLILTRGKFQLLGIYHSVCGKWVRASGYIQRLSGGGP